MNAEHTVLDALYAAKDRINESAFRLDTGNEAPYEWDFDEWPSCTCGHVYTAATGQIGDAEVRHVRITDGLYEETIQAIIDAHELVESDDWDEGGGYSMAEAVSNYTGRVAREMGSAGRHPKNAQGLDPATKAEVFAQARIEHEEYHRKAAIRIIQTTIDHIEARQEQARQEILVPQHQQQSEEEKVNAN